MMPVKMNFGKYFKSFRLLKMRSTLTIKPAITDFDIWRKWFEFYFNVISFENYAKTDFIAYNFNSKNKRQTFKIPTLIRCILAILAKEWNSMDYFVWWFYVYLYSSICDCIMASIWLSLIWCTFNERPWTWNFFALANLIACHEKVILFALSMMFTLFFRSIAFGRNLQQTYH